MGLVFTDERQLLDKKQSQLLPDYLYFRSQYRLIHLEPYDWLFTMFLLYTEER